MKATLAIEVNSPQDFANLSQILASFGSVRSAEPVLKSAGETHAEEAPKVETKAPQKAEKISVEQVRSAVQEKAKEGKRQEIKDLLTDFGAENVTALSADKYAEFLTKLNAL